MIRTQLLIAACLAFGCADRKTLDAGAAEPPTPTGAAPSSDPTAEAEQLFATRCTVCHGPLGKGDGPGSLGLDPKPRNFADARWQSEVSDGYIEKIVVYGGLAVGKSAAMPPNPDLSSKPAVVAALRAYVRSLRGK